MFIESRSDASGSDTIDSSRVTAMADTREEWAAERMETARTVDKTDREALLRETHRLHREIGYAGFRLEYFNDAAAIQEWPDSAMRERELRSFWFDQAEQAYPS